MPPCGTLHDDGQMYDDGLPADVGDVPLIRILDMSKQNALQVKTLLLLFRRLDGEKGKEHQGDAE